MLPLQERDSDRDDRFRLAMASSGIGMALVSLDGRFIDVNPALCRMFGRPAAELIGQRTHDFSHPDDLPLTERLLARLDQPGVESVDAEKRYLLPDGTVIEVLLNAALVRDADGHARYLISQLRDVTQQHRAERALLALNDTLEQRVGERTAELEASNRRLEAFAFGVSHDLRAPLRAIEGFLHQLQRQEPGLGDAGRHCVERIGNATQRMGRLIDSLLELARIGRAPLRAGPADLSLLAEWAVAELLDAQPQREARVDVQPGLAAIGDERLLRVLLSQLLRNAWQFSPPGQPVVVEVAGERCPRGLHMRVRDHGIGFDMAYADKLFEPFQRLHGRDEGAGDGIGLAIAQQVAMRHGGRVWAEAQPGAGATFHVELRDLASEEAEAA